MQYVVSATAVIALCSCTSELLSPTSGKDAELNIHLASSKQNITRQTRVKNKDREASDIQVSQHIYGPLAVTYALD